MTAAVIRLTAEHAEGAETLGSRHSSVRSVNILVNPEPNNLCDLRVLGGESETIRTLINAG